MTGLKALIHNELIKSVKRSAIILFIIMISLTLILGALVSLVFSISDGIISDVNYMDNIDESIESTRELYLSATDPADKLSYAEQLSEYEAQKYLLEDEDYTIAAYKYAMYYDAVDMYSSLIFQGYYDDIISGSGHISDEILSEYSYIFDIDVTQAQVYADEYKSIKSLDDYIDYMNKQINSSNLTSDQKEIEKRALEYHVMIDPDGSDIYSSQSIEQYKTLAYSINDKHDYPESLSVLSYEKEEEYRNALAALETSFNKGAGVNSGRYYGELTSEVMLSVSMSFTMIILVVISGGMISSEITSGSIKSLVIAPVKRYKIALAKIITIAVYGLGLTLVAYLVTFIIVSLIYGGPSAIMPYVTSFSLVIPGPLYLLIKFLIYYFEAMVYAMFAFMLSVLTKNTAISVAIPLLIDMVISGIGQLVALLSGNNIVSMVINCLPTSHFDICSRLFEFSASGINITLNGETLSGVASSPSPVISFIYLFVLGLGMTLAAIDTFRHRDIVK